jgi:hypothetical protein
MNASSAEPRNDNPWVWMAQQQQIHHQQMMMVMRQHQVIAGQQLEIQRIVQEQREKQLEDISAQAFGEFWKLRPPVFRGNVSPDDARNWLSIVESILRVIPCTDDEKVLFITYLLKEAAGYW